MTKWELKLKSNGSFKVYRKTHAQKEENAVVQNSGSGMGNNALKL